MIAINIYEIAMQMINFLILLYFMNKLMIKPLLKFINERSESIKKDISDAEANKLESEKLIEQQKNILAEARIDAKNFRDQAEKTSKKEYDQLISNAKKEATQLMEQSRKEIALSEEKAKKDLVKYAGNLAIDLSQSILTREIKDEDKSAILADSMKKLV